jgi:hypothetical protein
MNVAGAAFPKPQARMAAHLVTVTEEDFQPPV